MSHVNQHPAGTPSWVDLMTPDPEKAREFYAKLFGWTYALGGPETGHYAMAQLAGRNVAGLGKMPDGAPYPSAWTVYFSVESVDATCARIKEKGGKLMMEPMDVLQEGRMAIAIDPTGAAFGLWQPKRHKGAGVVGEHGAMVWHEVYTRNAQASRDFYSAVFGLESRKIPDGGIDYWTLHKGSADGIGGILQMNEQWPQSVPAHWQSYFAVKDVDAVVKAAKEAGGKVESEPTDTPYGRMASLADPFGARFSLIKPIPPQAK